MQVACSAGLQLREACSRPHSRGGATHGRPYAAPATAYTGVLCTPLPERLAPYPAHLRWHASWVGAGQRLATAPGFEGRARLVHPIERRSSAARVAVHDMVCTCMFVRETNPPRVQAVAITGDHKAHTLHTHVSQAQG